MLSYLCRRLLFFVPILLGVSLLVFSIMHLTPGDPAQIMLGPEATQEDIAKVRQALGLDRPLAVQYLVFVSNLLQGDLGRSIRSDAPVWEELTSRLPATFLLAGCGILLAICLGSPLGLLAACRHNTLLDTSSSMLALLGFSVPNFWAGLMLMLLFSIAIPILPSSGYGEWRNLVLPAVTLALQIMAIIARMTRSSVLEVIRQDYVRTARAKGLRERVVLWRHAVRNALLPVVTITGLYFGILLGGVVVIETVFSYPGIGRLLVEAIRSHDYPLVQGGVLIFSVSVCAINLGVDILYAFLDPRIREQYSGARGRRAAA
ncbi:MAG: nickel ABC transporter permease [Candidatus Methylomirabilota bacterium]